jgi:hypothetical protein
MLFVLCVCLVGCLLVVVGKIALAQPQSNVFVFCVVFFVWLMLAVEGWLWFVHKQVN